MTGGLQNTILLSAVTMLEADTQWTGVNSTAFQTNKRLEINLKFHNLESFFRQYHYLLKISHFKQCIDFFTSEILMKNLADSKLCHVSCIVCC